MQWILIGIAIVVGIFILIAITGGSAREINEDAAQEARDMSQEEASEVLHSTPKTQQEVTKENELYEEK